MLLSILIPTRNRRKFIIPLVNRFIRFIEDGYLEGLVEVVVLDNNCSDGTSEDLLKIENKNLVIKRSNVYIETSEENILRGICDVSGEYTWFFGDDDIPNFESAMKLIERLKGGSNVDFYVSNFRVIQQNGVLANFGQIPDAIDVECYGLEGVLRRVGLINMLSGWSILVARTKMLNTDIFREIVKTSPIYAHCFWFLHLFKDSHVCFLASPLVDYRIFFDMSGWTKFSQTTGKPLFYWWSVGIVRHFRAAMERGDISADTIAKLHEYRHDGTIYRSLNEIVVKLIEQTDVYLKKNEISQCFSLDDIEEVRVFILSLDLSYIEVFSKIIGIIETIDKSKGRAAKNVISGEILSTLHLMQQIADFRHSPYFVKKMGDYFVYERNDVFIAIHGQHIGSYEAILASMSPATVHPWIFVEKEMANLRLLLESLRPVAYTTPHPVSGFLNEAELINDANVSVELVAPPASADYTGAPATIIVQKREYSPVVKIFRHPRKAVKRILNIK
ncbi:glycosyltransferase family 2 protein [Xanthobacter sp. VTT E-85241]|uniref:glycosyltransferase family 2 protein n=1 Tax=Roseixanthobacter finlandensis TaxID=3119922 RepID=UPI0037291206